ncbi:MAG: PQQ-dependent sugar dehydrogenase [Gemmatimonadota bacterium]
MTPRLLRGLALLCLIVGRTPAQVVDCDGYLTKLTVPAGFCVRVFASRVGAVRHLAVVPGGTVVAATRTAPGLLRAVDQNGDGRADSTIAFGPGVGGSGIAWRDGWLYFASDNSIYRYRWPANARAPVGEPEVIATHLPESGNGYAHNAKGIAFGRDGALHVSFGSASDNCQPDEDIAAPGNFPCPDLRTRAGIWRFTPPASGDGEWARSREATGLRNAMAIGVDPANGRVWAVTHGRDFLGKIWKWSAEESAMQPAELLVEIRTGADYGWPYCMGNYTATGTTLIPAPEYQSSTSPETRCASKTAPAGGFPGHWAPMALTFAPTTWPATWGQGMLIAFHGSRSRAPLPEDGHYLIYLPLSATGAPAGTPRVLLRSSGPLGDLRLSGVAVGSAGIVYVADDDHGLIYRIEPRLAIRR